MKNKVFLLFAFSCLGLNQSYAQCNAPVINSFAPNTGFIGSTVTITGANFDPIVANNQVYFGATVATVQSASFGVLTVTVPTGATSAPISVKNGCNLTGYSSTPFNGIFCPTPMVANNAQGQGGTYQNVSFDLTGVHGAYNMLPQDIDRDGKPDIVVQGGGVTIARNTSTPGNLSFTAHNFSVGGSSVAVADFDGDGNRDVFVTGNVMRNTSVPGTISFGPTVGVGTFGYQIATGDINNDGKIDLIGDNGGANMMVRLNTSTGIGSIQFGPAQNVFAVNASQQRCTGLQAADIDGDGKVDIIGTQGNANRAITFRNTTTPGSATATFEAPEFWTTVGSTGASYPYRCQLGDFDKDGKIDLTTCNYQGTTNTAILRNTSVVGDISLAAPINLPAPGGNYRIGVGDVNGDGYPDIVTKSLSVNVFSVYQNTSTAPGTINFGTRYDYTSSWQAEVSGIAIGDLDGDFVPDIATSGTGSNRILFHRNTSASVDNTPPTAVCKNVTVALSPAGTVTVTPAMIDGGSGDACGLAPLKINGQNSITYTCSDIGTHNVTLNVTDIKGNTAQCTATVTVAPAAIIVAGQTTVCQGQTVAMSANSGSSYQWHKNGVDIPGATSQNYTATESGQYSVTVSNPAPGCTGTSAATNVVVNNNPTVATTPSGNAFLCPPGQVTITATTSSIYQWMNNGVNIANATQQSYTATAPGSYSVKVIDLFGCSATSSTVVVSATAPEINITGNSQSIVDGDNTPSTSDGTDFGTSYPNTPVTKAFVIDNTSGANALTVSSIVVSGGNDGNFVVSGITLPATISAGNTATFNVTFTGASIATYNAVVTVNNNDCNEPSYDFAVTSEISCVIPSFTACPSNITTGTDAGVCNAAVSYTATATGIPAPNVTYTLSGATTGSGSGNGSGVTFNKGVTTVTINASSSCGTATPCSFTVTVNDTENPVVSCPANTTVSCNASSAPSATGVATANDNCGTANVSYTDVSSQSANPASPAHYNYTITRTWKAVDADNNSSTCNQTITVQDVTAPSVSVPASVTINCQDNNTPSNTGSATGSDNCSSVAISYTDNSTQNANPANAGHYNYTITRTWKSEDVSGNFTTADQTITVQDVTAPSVSAPASVTINCQDATTPAANGTATGSDNCSGVTISYTDNSTQNANPANAGHYNYTITRTWKSEDVSGNFTTASQTITVQDVTAPSVSAPASVTINCQDATTPAANGTATGSDNCSAVAISYTDNSTQNANANNAGHYNYTITRTWKSEDVSGNFTTADQTITVQDVTAPSVSAPASVTINCQDATTPAANGTATGSDNCSSVAISYTDNSTQNANANNAGHYNYTITRTWKSEDVSGNFTTGVQTITVQDVTAPSITCPANATVSCKTSVANNGSATGSDNCSSVAISHSDNSTQDANPANAGHYSYTITRTWTATDVTGNSSNCAQVITVNALNNAAIAVNPVNTINANHPNHTIYLGYGPQSVTLTASTLGGVGGKTYSWSPTTGVANPNSASTSVAPTTTTTYTVTITDASGCSITKSVTISVVDVRCGNKVQICHFPPGNPGNPQQQCLPASAIPAHLAHGCKLGACPQSKDGSNQEEEHMSGLVVNEVKVYPNPNNGSFTIELPAGMEQADIAVTDMVGKVIVKQAANGSKVQVDLGSVARGMYMVNITNGSEIFRTKVSVQ